MSTTMAELEGELEAAGFVLVRARRHQVWKHPDGRMTTLPLTPKRSGAAWRNYVQRVRRALRGR